MRRSQSLVKVFELAREAAKIEQRISPQVLRRSVNTAMVRAGVDRIVQRAIMGHTSEAMTERYTGVDMQDKLTAIDSIFPHLQRVK